MSAAENADMQTSPLRARRTSLRFDQAGPAWYPETIRPFDLRSGQAPALSATRSKWPVHPLSPDWPGRQAVHVDSQGRTSAPRAAVNPMTAVFDEQYADRLTKGRFPLVEAMSMTLPCAARSIAEEGATHQEYAPNVDLEHADPLLGSQPTSGTNGLPA